MIMADSLIAYDVAPIVGTWGVASDKPLVGAFEAYVPTRAPRPSGTFNTPIASLPGVPGWLERQDYLYDYYFRIWLIPSGQLDIGGLSSEQHIAILVWNAFPDGPKTLRALDVEGMDENRLVGPGNPPLVFGPLEFQNYTLILSENGTPVIDVNMIWRFDGERPQQLEVTGFRAKTWAIPVDWRNPPVDRFEWLTDVQESRSGFEQRMELRQAPRRTIEGTFVVTGQDLGWFDAMLFSWGARGFLLPVWYDKTVLSKPLANGEDRVYCDTTDREFTAGGFILIGNDLRTAVAMQVIDVYPDGVLLKRPVSTGQAKGTFTWPARQCRVVNPVNQTQHTAGVIEMRVTFEITDQDDIPPIPSDTMLNGSQVLTREHNFLYTIDRTYARKLTILDNSTGLPQWIDLSNWSQITRQIKLMLKDRANRRNFIGWLSSISGRLTPFWREDRETLLEMTDNQGVGETALLHIKPVGFPTLLYGQPCRMALVLRHKSGAVYYRRILAAQVDVATGDELLTLDTNLPASVPSDWLLISYLEFVRLDADAIEIAHRSDEVSEVQFALRGIKQ
ncbi:tail assembly protein [Burkholderia phage vB_BceS_AH2]|uniref:Tail assembly protein n=1 Tax=Burkholderia phage vB_BceS_AH2 TaxID=1133022 RepID=I6NTN4_9CAUD|nr:tail assembly protein [Burkholderia phage vB_BceS_AH2]AEY69564.1 tail assembly protein [Burkholderia phage vB_BceS_AH2]